MFCRATHGPTLSERTKRLAPPIGPVLSILIDVALEGLLIEASPNEVRFPMVSAGVSQGLWEGSRGRKYGVAVDDGGGGGSTSS